MSWTSPETIATAVFDTSPLIFLDTLEYTGLLPELFHVVIPPDVAAELHQKRGVPGSSVPDQPWATIRVPGVETLERVALELGAGAGENASIALAQELNVTVVLDDQKARRYAREKGLGVVARPPRAYPPLRKGEEGSRSGVRPARSARHVALRTNQGGHIAGVRR